jgi:fatty-acyl-CoA synthase
VFDKMNMHEVAICYGMTETSPVSTMTRRDDDLRHRTETVGVVMPHVEVKIVDPVSGRSVPRGIVGELCTRGYSVMRGYWGDTIRTQQAIDSGGWMHTGDLAVMHEDESISIVGRSKDMVIRGGENIYPREIEDFLQSHPDIAEVQVVGVPDARYGEELVACIRMRDGAESFTHETMKSFCDGKLARYKIPRYVRLVSTFPMTITGKIRKGDLRDECIAWSVAISHF